MKTVVRHIPGYRLARWLAPAAAMVLVAAQNVFAGWTALSNLAPDNVQLMLLLPDGTVMAACSITAAQTRSTNWFRLTPDNTGHYVNGTWTTRAPMSDTRLWFSSAVLQNGKVMVAGGEYGTGGSTAELYDPVNDSWSDIPVPAGLLTTGTQADGTNKGFRDSMSVILPNGKVMIAPVYAATNNATVIYDPVANSFSGGPSYLASQNEAGWVRLPDSSILTVNKNSTSSERYIPALNKWISDSNTPVALFEPFGAEEGPGFLLPNGKAIFFGGNGNTCIYTPTGTTNKGSWTQGPDIPSGRAMPDAGACMMPNGKILLAAADAPDAGTEWYMPTYFYEYDYTVGTTGAFTQVSSPTGGTSDNIVSYKAIMLALPDGNVLYSHFTNQLYVYTPSGPALAAGKPTITSLSPNHDGSFHVTGTLFNGISQGAAYGDDAQMDTDRPLVRLTDGSGHVKYARTFDWNTNAVMTGSEPMSTEFSVHSISPGAYSLQVVANGNASSATSFYGPVWVDFASSAFFQFGNYDYPDKSLALGVVQVDSGGTIAIKAGHSAETITIAKPMTIISANGSAVIGH